MSWLSAASRGVVAGSGSVLSALMRGTGGFSFVTVTPVAPAAAAPPPGLPPPPRGTEFPMFSRPRRMASFSAARPSSAVAFAEVFTPESLLSSSERSEPSSRLHVSCRYETAEALGWLTTLKIAVKAAEAREARTLGAATAAAAAAAPLPAAGSSVPGGRGKSSQSAARKTSRTYAVGVEWSESACREELALAAAKACLACI
jgi:hypothetical protein